MPRAFRVGAGRLDDGQHRLLHQCRTDQRPTRRWSPTPSTPRRSGATARPITWEDIASQINATSGKNKAFAIASPNGSDRVESVTRGVDDRQAVITFAKPYADWRGMFAGNTMLLPKSMTANPEAFNKGQLDAPRTRRQARSSSPTLDRTAQRITLTRNPKWWGTPAAAGLHHLSGARRRRPHPRAAEQHHRRHRRRLARRADHRAQHPGHRRSGARPAPSWYHFTFNGAPGSILADKALRLAVAKGIDRQAIANVTQRGLVDKPAPLNNHIYVAGQEGYQDNSGVVAYDPEKAKQELDALGWKLNGQFREKDGQQLVIRDVLYDAQTHQAVRPDRAEQPRPDRREARARRQGAAAASSPTTSSVGDFDIAQFAWVGDAFPLCCLTQIYTTDAESNFGKISSPEIDAKIEQTLRRTRPGEGARAGQRARQADLGRGFQPAAVPVGRATSRCAATWPTSAPAGIGDLDYTKIGFMK